MTKSLSETTIFSLCRCMKKVHCSKQLPDAVRQVAKAWDTTCHTPIVTDHVFNSGKKTSEAVRKKEKLEKKLSSMSMLKKDFQRSAAKRKY